MQFPKLFLTCKFLFRFLCNLCPCYRSLLPVILIESCPSSGVVSNGACLGLSQYIGVFDRSLCRWLVQQLREPPQSTRLSDHRRNTASQGSELRHTRDIIFTPGV